MKIITTSGVKTFSVIPRTFINGAINVILTNEATRGVVNTTPTASTSGNYMLFTSDFGTLVENNYYTLEIKDGSNTIYKDKIFCTNQTIDQSSNDYYDGNKNKYTTEDSFDNDYIIIWTI